MRQNTIFLPVISGLSEESVQIREIQSILDGLFCVQGKEVAYGAKQLEPQYADAEFVPESGKSEPGSSGTKCKLESGHTGDALG